MKKSFLITTLVAAGLFLGRAPLASAQAMPVATCTISTTATISFGAYSVFNPSPNDSNGTLTFVCTGVAGPVTISLMGIQPDGSRALKNGGDMLSYHVFSDAARSQVWGDGTFGSAPVTFAKPVDGAVNTAVMFGRIFPRQDVTFGPYSDSFVAVVNFQ